MLAAIVAALLWPAGGDALARTAQQARAEAAQLVARGQRYLDRGRIEDRRQAAACFERAVLLAPDHAPYRVSLAELYMRQGFLRSARQQFEAAAALAPDDASARFGLGQCWRRDYLKTLDRSSLRRSLDHFGASARLDQGRADAWVQLVPLHLENGDPRAARGAALHAYQADSTAVNALLALAHAAYRSGEVEWADRLFRQAIPRLPGVARAYFEDIAPVAAEQDTVRLHRLGSEAERKEFLRRFWKGLDPDLATAANEAQVEFWSRAAQAYFLYYDAHRREWDERGEVYVRYGPPESAEYEPVVKPRMDSFQSLQLYPFNTMVWYYPSLGMTVAMTDRTLNNFYGLPPARYADPDPRPSPDSLERRAGDLLAVPGLRGVFPRLPPAARPLPLVASLSRYRGADTQSTRLVALLASPGGPADSLWAEAVVLDSALVEVARLRRPLGASACDPAEQRSAEFSFDLRAGEYQLGLSLRDGNGGRAAWRSEVDAPRREPRLEMSDLVVTCGPRPVPGDPRFHVEPNPQSRVAAGLPLDVYFEAYGLKPAADGMAHYSIEYTVRSASRDARPWIARLFSRRSPPPVLSARRSDEQLGELRRQFVSIPIDELPRGRYRLEIRMVDETARTESKRETLFEKT